MNFFKKMPVLRLHHVRKHWFAALCALGAAAVGLYLLLLWRGAWESRQLEVRRFDIELPNLPDAHENLVIAVVSDLHLHRAMIDDGIVDRVIDAVNAERPDLVFLLGDYVNFRGPFELPGMPEISAVMRRFQAKYGVYAVTGNHDTRFLDRGLRQALLDGRVVLLENRGRRPTVNGEPLQIAGTSDYWTMGSSPMTACVGFDRTRPILLLAHDPRTFFRQNSPAHFTFSGHLHGGQVRLPLLGARFLPGRFHGYPDPGLHQWNGRNLMLTSGVGNSSLPLRLLCPPEIVICTLKGTSEN